MLCELVSPLIPGSRYIWLFSEMHLVWCSTHSHINMKYSQDIAKKSSNMERRSQLVSIIESVGVRGFLLLQPNCELVLEGGRGGRGGGRGGGGGGWWGKGGDKGVRG